MRPPKGWALRPLIDVASKPQYGWTSSAKIGAVGLPLLRTTDITRGPIDWSTVPRCTQSPKDPSKYLLQDGDIVVSRAGSVGVSALVRDPPESVFASYLMRVRPGPDIDPAFLRLFLLSPGYWRQVSDVTDGIAIPNINGTKLAAVEVPLPPLDEQRRIVDLLEDHLSRLDAADAGLRTPLARTEAMLTSGTWHATHGLDAAEKVELQSIAEVRLGRQRSPKNHSGDRMRPYLRAANVGWDELRLDDVKEMQFTEAEELTYRLKPGDIILTEASGSPAEVGKSAIYRGEPSGVSFQNTLLRVRCHSADPEYVQKYLLAEARAGRFMPESRGVGINHLGRARLAVLQIDVPTPAQQATAVAACRELVDTIGRLQSSIRGQARHSDALRRSLLAAAFSGRLTPGHAAESEFEEMITA